MLSWPPSGCAGASSCEDTEVTMRIAAAGARSDLKIIALTGRSQFIRDFQHLAVRGTGFHICDRYIHPASDLAITYAKEDYRVLCRVRYHNKRIPIWSTSSRRRANAMRERNCSSRSLAYKNHLVSFRAPHLRNNKRRDLSPSVGSQADDQTHTHDYHDGQAEDLMLWMEWKALGISTLASIPTSGAALANDRSKTGPGDALQAGQ